jgi:hypothetical protein
MRTPVEFVAVLTLHALQLRKLLKLIARFSKYRMHSLHNDGTRVLLKTLKLLSTIATFSNNCGHSISFALLNHTICSTCCFFCCALVHDFNCSQSLHLWGVLNP